MFDLSLDPQSRTYAIYETATGVIVMVLSANNISAVEANASMRDGLSYVEGYATVERHKIVNGQIVEVVSAPEDSRVYRL